jgi:thermostable hemolysin
LLTESSSASGCAPGSAADGCVPTTVSARRFRIEVCSEADPGRQQCETFVRDAFYRTHRARIQSLMPTLLKLNDSTGTLQGVAGCRVAGDEPLFLERYLGQPIEQTLAGRIGSAPLRSEIVEIGNFACSTSHAARRFVALLPYFLLERRLAWVAFTATASVRRILQLVGARCMDLGPANGACVRDGADDWGSYYTQAPRVMAGYLPLARKMPRLWKSGHAD